MSLTELFWTLVEPCATTNGCNNNTQIGMMLAQTSPAVAHMKYNHVCNECVQSGLFTQHSQSIQA